MIEQQFQEYRKMAMHPDSPPIQLRECRMAFWSGAIAMFTLMTGLNDDEDIAVREMDQLYAEIKAYVASL